MRRPVLAPLLAVALGLGAAVPASAQDTTSTTSTSTTSTTVPCQAPCTDRPPDALLASDDGEVVGGRGSSCWTAGAQGVCVDTIGVPDSPPLKVQQGETLTLRFSTETAPTAGSDPVRFLADFPPGTSRLHVTADWPQGGAAYGFLLRVSDPARPATTPTKRKAVLARTGGSTSGFPAGVAALALAAAIRLVVRRRVAPGG